MSDGAVLSIVNMLLSLGSQVNVTTKLTVDLTVVKDWRLISYRTLCEPTSEMSPAASISRSDESVNVFV